MRRVNRLLYRCRLGPGLFRNFEIRFCIFDRDFASCVWGPNKVPIYAKWSLKCDAADALMSVCPSQQPKTAYARHRRLGLCALSATASSLIPSPSSVSFDFFYLQGLYMYTESIYTMISAFTALLSHVQYYPSEVEREECYPYTWGFSLMYRLIKWY
jgi:hypothetical protein